LQTQRRFWKGFQQYNVVSFVVSSCIILALFLYFADVAPSAKVEDAYTQRVVQPLCVHPVALERAPSRKLSTLAAHLQPTASKLDVALAGTQRTRRSDADLYLSYTSQRCIARDTSQSDQNANIAHKMLIAANAPVVPSAPDGPKAPVQQAKPTIRFVPQKWTIPFELLLPTPDNSLDMAGSSTPLSANMLQGSADNIFPYGQCTWWANQRYRQLHGSFVPWRNNANASQWVTRALESSWQVSGIPTVGSIMVLQPYVDGAYGFGHVGVVEQILTNGRVIASSMNWGNHPDMVTQATYVPGPGVSFLSSF
jgi:surface antigen